MNNNNKILKVHKYNIAAGAVFALVVLLFIVLLAVSSCTRKEDAAEVFTEAGTEVVETQEESDAQESSSEIVTEQEHVFTVCIDPGHGGKDPGSVEGSLYESEQVLELALLVREYLKERDIRVIMTRTTDISVTLAERVEFANENNADVIVSIHRNYFEGWQRIYGMEAWIHSNEPKDAVYLSNAILDRLAEVDGTNVRGLRAGSSDNAKEDYIINRDSKMTSLILEVGYMSDSKDNELLEKHMEEYAEAIGLGIIDFMENYN